MKRALIGLLIGGLALTADPLAGQEWQVAREQFPFVGTRLQIDVAVESQGVLRLIRGGPGSVRVAGRAVAGFIGAGLTHDQHLTLSALGGGPVEYMVSVPEGVWVTVRLPDRHLAESLGSYSPGGTFTWDETPTRTTSGLGPQAAAPTWVRPEDSTGFEPGLFTAVAGPRTPTEIALPDLTNIRNITVQVGTEGYSIATSRPLHVQPGDPERLEIRPTGPPLDVVVTLPWGTPGFSLVAGPSTALLMDGEDVTTFCSPMTRQWLSDGQLWVTFSPREGALDCGPTARLRHEG